MKTGEHTQKRSRLVTSTALALLWPLAAAAQDAPCALVDGVLPQGCTHANAGTVVAMPVGANTEPTPDAELGPLGFSITVDAAPAASGARDGVAGEGRAQDDLRRVDRMLADAGVQVTFDGLGARPRLAVSTADMKSSYVAGAPVTFRASTNYPAWITRAEMRIMDAKDPTKVLATLPIAPNGTAAWSMPGDGAEEMVYALRVYDSAGRWDETLRLPIARAAQDFAATEKSGPMTAPGEGDDMTARRSIPVRGGAVTVLGNAYGASQVSVMGEAAVIDPDGAFVLQRILPPGVHDVAVGVGGTAVNRRVEIPKTEWFYVGLADLTVGREKTEGSYTLGRLAGYAKGTLANGVTVTGSIDTGDGELKDLLRDLDAKNPRRVIDRAIEDGVYPTFGDDSTAFNDAPTSGKVYLKVERDKTHALWGDYKLGEDGSRLVRSDRTLYGLSLGHESLAQTSHGAARLKLSAYAANPDRAVQRDVLRGTGGSAYFLSRQDILTGTETLYVQVRDPVTGHVIENRRLQEGTDYEIDYFQGVVTLTRPLSSSAATGGVINDRPLGDQDLSLVAQYEYVPTVGGVDGAAYGARAEGWLTDGIRLGFSAAHDSTAIADNDIYGVDLLLRHSDRTWLSFDHAQSEGPGFDTNYSLNGGLDITTDPTAGALGQKGKATRVQGQADLAEITGGAVSGTLKGHYDKKDKGFVTADYNATEGSRDYGLSGEIDVTDRTRLTFGHSDWSDDSGDARRDSQIGFEQDLGTAFLLEAALGRTARTVPLGLPSENGSRTDLGLRLTWERDEDLSVYAFGQATLSTTGTLRENNRLGLGVEARLSDRLTFEGEASDGSLGVAGQALLRWDDSAGTTYRMGYRLDPERRENTTLTGRDRGTWVVGADRKVNDRLTIRGESTVDLFGDRGSITRTYGARYTPTDAWTLDGGFELGEVDETGGNTLKRKGFSLGGDYNPNEDIQAGLRGEYRVETSTDGTLDRKTWLLKGYGNVQTSDDWRLLTDFAALVSDSDTADTRDGRYIEANIGYAYRPAQHDRLNMLFRYTFLEDLPGADQVNIEGTLNGPRQRSHLLSFDMTYDLTKQLTVGGKYAYRMGEVADRLGAPLTDSKVDLAILRLDYHVVHNWDLLLEARTSRDRINGLRENGALAGVYRHFGNNVKVGVGYQFGDVSDDLRLIDGRKEGVFFNIVGKF
ncbi:MAG: hypothetical protein E6Q73_01705 [Pseudorhodobacter sp.]|nr:MAG: hypothetical protein E6Q73_01705 [Pseudorhodobacter sp.]